MEQSLLVINAGSSSLKFAAYRTDGSATPTRTHRGMIESIGGCGRMRVPVAPREADRIDTEMEVADHHAAIGILLDWLMPRLEGCELVAAGHRVVHGGVDHAAPVRVDEAVLERLARLVPLDPLHQPHNLAAIRALRRARPELPQVACFDTAFHRGMPEVAQRFALPRTLADAGVRRYGFHGLSYEYIAGVLPEHLGEAADGRVVVAHLGSGASLCALKERRSVETTMSFTPLDGVPMGTRCGAIDPAIPLYLMREHGLDVDAVSELLQSRSGLLGLSGVSADMRELLASPAAGAAEAVAHFTYQVSRAIGSLAVALGGLDAVIFTAGIGAHSARVRQDVCARLGWLGLALDAQANAAHERCISVPGSAVSAWVIPTDEEQVIARHTLRLSGC